MERQKRKGKLGKTIQHKGESGIGEQIIKCPKCEIIMEKKSNGKFIIDACPKCKGVFLDKHEIYNIAHQGFFNYIMAYFKRTKKVER